MNNLQRISYLLGSLLLGVSMILIFKGPQSRTNTNRRTKQPVEELADPLRKAWQAYHNK